jgi:hypothetical protein
MIWDGAPSRPLSSRPFPFHLGIAAIEAVVEMLRSICHDFNGHGHSFTIENKESKAVVSRAASCGQ